MVVLMLEIDAGLQDVFDELERRKAHGEKPSSRAELAELMGFSKQAISGWRRVPADRCLQIEEILSIPRETLRPDVFVQRPAPTRGTSHGRRRAS